mmetsp:Transcript_21828/g.37269  ORF Transcript_21828/g.37269 Transcript_21828/m.37269 type:complete len:270 (+) Transcript_21828:605-1414(+)
MFTNTPKACTPITHAPLKMRPLAGGLSSKSTSSCAFWADASPGALISSTPSSEMLMAVAPEISRICLTVRPEGPTTAARCATATGMRITRGALGDRICRGAGEHLAISPSTCSRPLRAWARACVMMSSVMPSTLMSIWKAVSLPQSSPATLKSMSPSASSVPRMSLSTTHLPVAWSRMSPMATPATGRTNGTPASNMARHPPHTVAMEEEPLLSVMVLSTRIVYGKSLPVGMIGASALCASSPCPNSRRPGMPTRPVSPTEEGGKKYCK